ncbi:carbohydrate ABC transporter permease [Cohnella rhizosphaerae]|uniref:Sugar ABC transporter permease n=1 Tax=Cohnella rhizosphaerae TaxID=1457232 RepID=A0A9X4QS06_9BACL|nr:sugar ABC transporter permease [Cohnella rhizosphaerae]MDG0809095.1 sugar ABC transporter permease [Cohnella rhizosphaerae]
MRIARRIWREIPVWGLVLPSLFLFIVFSWQPLISGLYLSFFKTKGYRAEQYVGIRNYVEVIQNSEFQQTLINTFSYVVWSLTIGFALPIVIAIIVNELVHFKSFFKFSIYFPVIVPGIAAAMMWMFMFEPGDGGLLNMLFGKIGLGPYPWLQDPGWSIPLIVVTMTWKSFGGSVILYLASLQGVNRELYEAAALDGAGVAQRVRNVTIPQISSIIGIMFILQIIGVFQVMYEPLTMTEGGPSNSSMSLMLQSYFYAFRYFDAGKSMAIGSMTFMILLVLTFVYFRVNRRSD